MHTNSKKKLNIMKNSLNTVKKKTIRFILLSKQAILLRLKPLNRQYKHIKLMKACHTTSFFLGASRPVAREGFKSLISFKSTNHKRIPYRILLMLFLLSGMGAESYGQSQTYSVESPDRNIRFHLTTSDKISISAEYGNKILLKDSEINMRLSDAILGESPKVIKTETQSVDQILHPVVKVKTAAIKESYNELTVYFSSDFQLVMRAYNEGFAYRFVTSIHHEIEVISEKREYQFAANHRLWWGKEQSFESHNQVYFDYTSLRELSADDLASLPLIINPLDAPKIVITESDLQDYPGMWLRGTQSNALKGVAAKYPKTIIQKSDRYLPVTEREKYIAKTKGSRAFPWRIFAIAENDADLILNQLTYLLASPNRLKNTEWIRPGKIAWDWWNANNIYGVDFEAGINTETYKYYIDFASRYGLEYILLDEGWYELGDLSKTVATMDLEELIAYGKKKNVGIIAWMVWKTLDRQMETLDRLEKMGFKGIKVDFMNRDDQEMVNFYYKVAKEAARHHLMVDFHGSYKPAGIRRTFPNVMTREGVNGAEQYKWSMHQTPEHNLILPFGRMLAGPMDYTPGAMHNAQKKDFKPIFDTPMSMGTRCHQLAMYVCYESPLQMLCDSPSNYYREPECMEFLSDVPVVWDETRVLAAQVSDYLLIARRNETDWYIGGMTDWTERDLWIDLSFLPEGKKYQMTLFKDGINANRIAIDYQQSKQIVDCKFKQKIHLAKGGGLAIMLKFIH
jgi:alpha-glucosidase